MILRTLREDAQLVQKTEPHPKESPHDLDLQQDHTDIVEQTDTSTDILFLLAFTLMVDVLDLTQTQTQRC